MKKETTPSVSASFRRAGVLVAFTGLFLLGACEAKKPADQEAKDRDDAANTTDITNDADPDSTVESPATTGYVAQPAPTRA